MENPNLADIQQKIARGEMPTASDLINLTIDLLNAAAQDEKIENIQLIVKRPEKTLKMTFSKHNDGQQGEKRNKISWSKETLN